MCVAHDIAGETELLVGVGPGQLGKHVFFSTFLFTEGENGPKSQRCVSFPEVLLLLTRFVEYLSVTPRK